MNQSIKHQHNEIALKRLIQLKKTTRDPTVKFLLSLWKFLQGRDKKPVGVMEKRTKNILSMEVWLKLGCLKSFFRQINDRKTMQLSPNGATGNKS